MSKFIEPRYIPPMDCEETHFEYDCKYDSTCSSMYRLWGYEYDDYFGGLCSTTKLGCC